MLGTGGETNLTLPRRGSLPLPQWRRGYSWILAENLRGALPLCLA
jgi:hypothetical protein